MSEHEKTLPIFRNAGQRIFYLRRRPDQAGSEPHFMLLPGMTVQAMDEAEAVQLASTSDDLRDVGKEAPQIGNAVDALQKKLSDAIKENEALKAGKTELEKQLDVVKRQENAKVTKAQR